MADSSTLMTAKEYIDIYYSKLKKELNARGLQISKVGLVGLLLNILGFTQQDVKLYYDTLFREAFLATSDRDENITMHSCIFGYQPGLATPSSLTGNISFDASTLPISASNKRTITLTDLKVKIDDLVYTLESDYIFKGTNCQITDGTGNVTNVPVSASNPLVPIQNFYQYEEIEESFTIPFYVYNSYYTITLDLKKEAPFSYISDLEVWIKEDGKDDYELYDWQLIALASKADDKHVFVQFLKDKVIIEMGSGIHGKYIPNSFAKIKYKVTYGPLGNVSKQNIQPYEGNLRIYDDDSGTSYAVSVTTGITVEIDYGANGKEPLTGLNLRHAAIEFIRHRNNYMSERDFYDLIKRYFEDFELMFKKCHVMDNNIYLFLPFRDTYQLPVRTRSISLTHLEFNPELKCYLYNPVWTLENGKQYISPFLYMVDYNTRQYKGYLLKELTSAYFNQVTIEKRINGVVNTLDYYPTDEENVSSLPSGSDKEVLPLSFFASYSGQMDSCILMVQSYEDLSNYILMIDIPKLNVNNECLQPRMGTNNIVQMTYFNETAGTGIIFDKVDIIVSVYRKNDMTHYYTYKLNDFSMVLDISDLLSLKTFDGFVKTYDTVISETYTATQREVTSAFNKDAYVLNIPVMELEKYESDPDYYVQKAYDTIGSLALTENRMISDDVQVRFINSDVIQANELKSLTIQEYEHKLEFPLHLKLSLFADQEYINENQIDILTAEEEIRERIAQLLFDKYTGTSISFYETQILDCLHDEPWLKHCQIQVTDNLGTILPMKQDLNIIETKYCNIESRTQNQILNRLNKLEAVIFCPYYWWWDLDNIEINISFH